MMNYKQLDVFVPNAQTHVEHLLKTFQQTVSENGVNSFVPMCIYLNSKGDVMLTLTSRPWSDKDDMYKSFAEMLYAFNPIKCECVMFVNDVLLTKYDSREPHAKTAEAQDAINISFISKESSALVNVPYSVKENNDISWHFDLAIISPLSKEDPTELYQGDMVELFYIMSHIDSSPFSMAQLVNYYSFKGFTYQISEDALVDKIQIRVENNDNIIK